MPTLNGLVDECLMNLSSYGLIQPRGLRLTTAVSDSDTTFVLSAADNLETGIAEIENELVYVVSVDKAAKTAEVVRGHMSTTPVAHASGSFFRANPPWPRPMVANAINDAIVGSYPDLFVVGSTTIAASPVITTYTLDPSIELVREVKYQLIGPSQQWRRLNDFWWDDVQSTLTVDTCPATPGSEVRVVYERRPNAISASAELTDSGLMASAKKYVVTQACADLVRFMDTSRFPVAAAAADDMDQNRQLTQATVVARTLLGIAEIEKQAERKRLRVKFKPTISRSKAR